jgi:transcriptional repressor NrdR
MRCPYCASPRFVLVEEADSEGGITRPRECSACGRRFRTREHVEGIDVAIVGQDGRREPFSRAMLARSIAQACAKRDIPVESVNELVDLVESEVLGRGAAEVSSRVIGDLVLERLRDLDEVACVRYASVYRAYDEAEDFVEEVMALRDHRRRRIEARLQLRLSFDEDQPHWS